MGNPAVAFSPAVAAAAPSPLSAPERTRPATLRPTAVFFLRGLFRLCHGLPSERIAAPRRNTRG